jgi:preprotein translocase subunit YajC
LKNRREKVYFSLITLKTGAFMFATEAYGMAANPGQPGQPGPGLENFLPMMIIMFIIIYFFIIRPQSRRQKETKKLLESVKKGDRVVTVGGILGLVVNVKGNVVTLKIAPDTEVDFRKTAVSSVVTPEIEKELRGEEKKA